MAIVVQSCINVSQFPLCYRESTRKGQAIGGGKLSGRKINRTGSLSMHGFIKHKNQTIRDRRERERERRKEVDSYCIQRCNGRVTRQPSMPTALQRWSPAVVLAQLFPSLSHVAAIANAMSTNTLVQYKNSP